MISADTFLTVGVFLSGAAMFGWWHGRSTWSELRRDWRDFRAASLIARENTRERRAFACARSCSRCRVALDARRLFRAVHRPPFATSGPCWVYRCRCGESTLYDANGDAHQLDPASAA